MSTEEFTHHILRTVIGRVCQPLGVHGMNQSVCDCMADVLKQYILTLGRTTASYSAHGEGIRKLFCSFILQLVALNWLEAKTKG